MSNFQKPIPMQEGTVIVLAPTGKDAHLLTSALTENHIRCHQVAALAEITPEEWSCAGALLVAEEALTGSAVESLRAALDHQPAWSDLPLLVMINGGRETVESRQRENERLPIAQATLLERPIRIGTLLASIRFAQRARDKQFVIRKNIEQRRLAEEALRKSEKLAVAGRLAASIAHEINNPLEAVTNLLYLISSSEDLQESKKYCSLAESELRRVTEITTQTLRFYRQQTQATVVDLTELAESVLTLYSGRLHANTIRVVRDYRTTTKLLCYAGEVRQLTANLVSNALDSMQSGGTLTVRIRDTHHAGAFGEDPGARRHGVRLVIGDSGTGIPLHVRKKIFEPFVTTKGDTGTGLGLWVSGEILRKHDGHLHFYSCVRPGRSGTVFSVFLPKRESMPVMHSGPVTEVRAAA